MFGPKYVEMETTVELNYRMRIAQSRCTIRDTKHRAQRVDLARVSTQIAELGTNALWVERKGEIKKPSLHFAVKFLWIVVRHHLSPATSA